MSLPRTAQHSLGPDPLTGRPGTGNTGSCRLSLLLPWLGEIPMTCLDGQHGPVPPVTMNPVALELPRLCSRFAMKMDMQGIHRHAVPVRLGNLGEAGLMGAAPECRDSGGPWFIFGEGDNEFKEFQISNKQEELHHHHLSSQSRQTLERNQRSSKRPSTAVGTPWARTLGCYPMPIT